MGYAVGAFLNGVILLQIMIYGDKSSAKPKTAPSKKKKKM
jgi:hypothetical protein